jgi:ABC-2 type transport system ATP-binding protein
VADRNGANSAQPAILVDNVSRWFGRGPQRVTALSSVSFRVEEGTIVALLGENGAGKTTMTKILATLLLPSTGRARLFGHDVASEATRCRALASVVFGGERGLYPQLSGRDNLRFFGMLAGVGRREARHRVPELLEQVGLSEVAGRRVETYSKGMKQRLHIAIGFISRPRILLLDEPTVGLDPMEAERLRSAIAHARDSGVAVLLTSHYLLDVERLADRVLLLDRGSIVDDMSLTEFARRAGYAAAVTVRGRGALRQLPDRLPASISLAGQLTGSDGQWAVTLRLQHWSPEVFAQLAALFDSVEVVDVDVREVRLEEAFTKFAKRH